MKGNNMGGEKLRKIKKGIFTYSRESERRFFFYATVIMFLLYCIMSFVGD